MRLKKGIKAVRWCGDNADEILTFASSCGVWGDDFKVDNVNRKVVVLNCNEGYDTYPVGTWFIGCPKSEFPMIEPMSEYAFSEIFSAGNPNA